LEVIFYLAFGICFYLTFKNPFYGVISLFGFSLTEKMAQGLIPFGDNILPIIVLVTGVSFVLNVLLGDKKSIVLDDIQRVLIVYIIYLSITSFSTFFFDETRNWFFTYVQSFFLVFLTSYTIIKLADLKAVMVGMIIFGILGLSVFIISNLDSLFETEIESSNTYARLYLILAVFSYNLYKLNFKYKWLNYFYLIVLFCFVFGLIFTGSRTAFILLGLLIFYYSIFDYKLNPIKLMILVIPFILFIQFMPEEVIGKLLSSFDDSTYAGGSGDTEFNSIGKNMRFILWEASLKMLNDHGWIFGIGVGNFKHFFTDYLPLVGFPLSHPHNTYVSVLVESGIVGLFIFLILVYKSLMKFKIFTIINDTEKKRIFQAWFFGFLIFLIGGLTKHDHYDKLLFLFLGISSSIYKIYFNEKSSFSN
jgi:O-antigen ligase